MVKRWLSRLLPLFILCGTATAVRAETNPVSLTADELSYHYEQKQIEANGSVHLAYKDIQVDAAKVLIDQEQNILLASGDVVLRKQNDTYHGDTFLYYLKTQQGWIAPLKTDVTDPEIKGVVRLDAAWALLKKDDLFLDDSSFTSCDLPDPHYRLTAERIEYYPGERIIFRHVWYWEHHLKLFYLPYLVISLNDPNENLEAEIGWQRALGWFLYVGYNYYLNPKNDGKIKLNLTEKGGESLGVEHHYRPSATSKWTEEAALIYNGNYGADAVDYLGNIKYENWTNSKLRLSTEAKSGSSHDGDGAAFIKNYYNFSLISQTPYPSLNFSYNQDTSYGLQSYDLLTGWRYQIGSAFQVNLNGHMFLQQSDYLREPQNNFAYGLTASQNFGWLNLMLRYNDLNVFSGSSYSTNLKPELTLNVPTWEWPFLGDIRVTAQYTNQEKFYFNDGVTAIASGEREALTIEKPARTLWQNQNQNLTLKGNGLFQLRYYQIPDEPESDLEALTGGLSLTDQFSKNFSGDLGVNMTLMEGIVHPFFTEGIYPGATVTNSWHWRSEHLSADLNLGYNMEMEMPIPANLTVHYMINPKERLDFSMVYNWSDGLGATTLQAFYNPNEKWLFNLALGYDFQYDAWTNKNLEAQINDRLNEKLRYELATRFDFLQNSFTTGKAALAYDLHCRELMFCYDWVLQEYTLQVLFKAFPHLPLSLSPGETEFSLQ